MRLLVPILLLLTACQSAPTNPASQIIQQAIAAHGMQNLDNSTISFDFRGRHYRASRQDGRFVYERIFQDSLGNIHDRLTNDGFQRRINDQVVVVDSTRQKAYSSSINSVIYFALLPYFLNDAAVQLSFLGESQIKGKPYHKIRVTFQADGGGEDYQDEYIYWFHQESHLMEYLAYNYQVEGGGARFRVAYDPQIINGVRLSDYHNLKPAEADNLAVATFDSLYNQDQLLPLSEIRLENVSVELLND